MRILFVIGLILLILGVASLFVPIPRRERHGFDAGPVSVGVTTTTRERVHPGISAALILGGVALMVVDRRPRR